VSAAALSRTAVLGEVGEPSSGVAKAVAPLGKGQARRSSIEGGVLDVSVYGGPYLEAAEAERRPQGGGTAEDGVAAQEGSPGARDPQAEGVRGQRAGRRRARRAGFWRSWWSELRFGYEPSRWTVVVSSMRTWLECQKRAIRLFVLPPRSPTLNGCVERAHRTHDEEFYQVYPMDYTVQGIRSAQIEWEEIYNKHRLHQALNYLTPMQYLEQHSSIQRKEDVSPRY